MFLLKNLVGLAALFVFTQANAGYTDGDDILYPRSSAPVLKGWYWVPVSVELERYAGYPVSDVCWYKTGDAIQLGYLLPPDLTGARNDIRLSGVDTGTEEFVMRGENDKATCKRDQSAGTVTCTITYEALKFDEAKRSTILKQNFPDLSELVNREKVAELFQQGPVGVLKFADKPLPIPQRW